MKKNKKMILEIIIIAFFLAYLLFQLLDKNYKSINLLSSIILGLINFRLLIKYIKEVHIYKDKKNIYKVIFIIFNILSLFVCAMIIMKKLNIIYLIIVSIITFIYLIIKSIKTLKKLSKEEKKFYNLVKEALVSLLSSFLIITYLIVLYIH